MLRPGGGEDLEQGGRGSGGAGVCSGALRPRRLSSRIVPASSSPSGHLQQLSVEQKGMPNIARGPSGPEAQGGRRRRKGVASGEANRGGWDCVHAGSPAVSYPRLPARPAICSSSLWSRRAWPTLRLRDRLDMTVVRAGMLMPAANVSVANTSFNAPVQCQEGFSIQCL